MKKGKLAFYIYICIQVKPRSLELGWVEYHGGGGSWQTLDPLPLLVSRGLACTNSVMYETRFNPTIVGNLYRFLHRSGEGTNTELIYVFKSHINISCPLIHLYPKCPSIYLILAEVVEQLTCR
jgi:hypothetical protein